MEVKDNIITNSQLVSKQTTGTAPIVVASTTVVSNLNADLLDGQHGAYYEPAFGKNTAFNKSFGDSPSTVTEGNDPRLSDARQPISHNHDLRTLINYGDVLPVFRGGKNIDGLGSYILAKEDGGWTGGEKPASSNNAFGVISLQLHTGSYTGQIGLSSQDNKMYYRSSNGGALSSWRSLSFEDHTIQSHAGVLADSQLSGAYTGLTNLTGSGSVDFAKFLGLATDTVTTPSFSWTGDLATGFYRPTGSQIGVTLAGVQRALFSTAGLALSGNLGIGGATPGGNLSGTASIAIGDSDTGFRQNGDGVLETYANNTLVTTQTSSAIIHTRNVTAPVFIGALTGNANSATLAPNYLPLTGGSLSGNLNIPTLSSLATNGNRTNYYQGNNTNLVAQTPMTTIWHDLFAFGKAYTTTFDTSVDEVAWVSGTVDKKLFAQKEAQTITVLDYTTTKSIRWTFNNVAWGSGQWVVIGFTWQPVQANKTVVIESSVDNITYTERHRSTFSNSADTVHLFVNSYSGDAFLRVRIIWNSGNGNIALSSIRLLSARPGDQGLGKEIAYPYVWDENQKVTFPNEVVATTFSGGLTGNANTATKLASINTNFSGTYPLTVNVNGEIYSNAAITYSGSSGELKAPTFIGNLTGNVQGNLFGAVPLIYSTTLGTAYNQTIQIREAGLNGPQGQSMAAAPRLAFHWSGQVASSIAMEANGRIAIMNNPGTGYENLIARDIISSGGIFSGPGTGLTGTATGLTVGTALNANLLDNIDSTGFMRSRGTLNGDIDADWGEGVVTFDPVPTGTPPLASPNIRVLNLGSNYARRTQMAFPWESDKAFFRRRNDGGWATWREFIHSGNIGTQTVANANYANSAGSATDSTKLPLTGGTLSGNLAINATEGLRIANNNAFISFFNSGQIKRTGYLQFNSESASVLAVEINQSLLFQTNALTRLTIAASGEATFASSVTATKGMFSNPGVSGALDFNMTVHKSAVADANGSSVGILFSTEGGSSNSGKGAIVFERTGSYARGTFHFLSSNTIDSVKPTLADSKFSINSLGAATFTSSVTATSFIGDATDTTKLPLVGGTVNGKVTMYVGDSSGSFNTRSIELREVGLVTNTQSSPNYAPSIGFHWGGLVQAQIALRSSGVLMIRTDAGDGSEIIHAGNISQQSVSYATSAGNATSADAVSGVALSRIVYGDGARGRSVGKTGLSANTLGDENSSGFYFGNNTTGMPTTDWWNWNGTIGNSWGTTDGYGFQTAGSFWSDDFRMRRLTSGAWQPWVTLIHSGNVSSFPPASTSAVSFATNNVLVNEVPLFWGQIIGPTSGTSSLSITSSLRVQPSAGAIIANKFVKNGGTASEFLMADGSVTSGGGWDAGSSGYASPFVSGYQIFSNGMILQWATLQNGSNYYNFAIAFPNACLSIVLSTDRTNAGSLGTNHVGQLTNSRYYAVIDGTYGRMFAIGY